jgi:dipeptide/tripeptide permease
MHWIGYAVAVILLFVGVVFVALGLDKIINSPPIPESNAEKKVKNNVVTGASLMFSAVVVLFITALLNK